MISMLCAIVSSVSPSGDAAVGYGFQMLVVDCVDKVVHELPVGEVKLLEEGDESGS
jgi:hypothetical protein